MKRALVLAPIVALALVVSTAGTARADIVAVYLQGEGGVSSASGEGGERTSSSPSSGSPALGLQLGVRALVFEGYLDYDRFGEGVAVSRGIVGLRGGFGTSGLRLVLRAGVGGLVEQGGALTERLSGVPDRRGFVARAGASLEGRIAEMLWLGASLDTEAFTLASTTTGAFGAGSVQGTDLFASLHLLFELGI